MLYCWSSKPSLYIQDLKEIESNYKLIKDQESATSLDALQKELKEFFQTRGSRSGERQQQLLEPTKELLQSKPVSTGWEEEGYPMDRKEFQDLVYRAQKLTSKVWETIKPRLESMLVERRNEQRAILRASRRMSFEQLYFQTICRISELPYELLTWNPYFPRPELVWGLPFIQSHLVQDTKSNDWEEKITSDLQLFALLHWSRFLADLSFEAPDTSAEQAQAAIIASKQRLSLATSGFVCKCGVSPSVMWLPDVLRHGLEHRDWKYPQDFLKCLVPFNYRAPGLVESLLRNRLSDPRTTTIDELSEGIDWLCLRCPPYTTRYYSFREMIEHYLIENGWYNIAKAAAESSAGGSQTTYCLFNDHDWSEGGLLARQDDTYTQLWLGEMMQADCMKTFTCEYPTSADYNLKKVSCALCPPGCGPLPDYLPNIRAHILQKHNKELDPSTDISDATLNVYLSAI
ncbi:hypothetical protein FRB90_003952 [Tulasnella sp. 427]|nr:hypothetical protein FRB90_003952 [Tulasnella sp. 427]